MQSLMKKVEGVKRTQPRSLAQNLGKHLLLDSSKTWDVESTDDILQTATIVVGKPLIGGKSDRLLWGKALSCVERITQTKSYLLAKFSS